MALGFALARLRVTLGRLFAQRCFFLFLAQVAVIGVAPIAFRTAQGQTLLNLVDAVILLAAAAAVGRTIVSFSFAVALAIATMLLQFAAARTADHGLWTLYMLCLAAYYAVVLVLLLAYVFRRDVMTMDKLWGAAAAYMLLGLGWAIAYALVQHHVPASFASGGTPRDLDGADLLYFSFTVLTSTGFGDIVPVQHPAKTVVVFQQIVGTLYVAILIARLIDAYPSQRRGDAP
jgi:hypothetical protein